MNVTDASRPDAGALQGSLLRSSVRVRPRDAQRGGTAVCTKNTSVRIVVDGDDSDHVLVAHAIEACVLPRQSTLNVEVVLAYGVDAVRAELAVPADIVVVVGHSGWENGVWSHLLGVERSALAGCLRANVVVFVSCHLADQCGLDELVAAPTPVVACTKYAKWTRSPLIVGPLLAELCGRGRPQNWTARRNAAQAAALFAARAAIPRAHWNRWVARDL